MTYRFYLVCPKCGKPSETVAEVRVPQPRVSCGDCLMDSVEIIEMKVVRVEEVA